MPRDWVRQRVNPRAGWHPINPGEKEMVAYRRLIQHGAIIFLLATSAGWLMVMAPITNPRMMLATHTTALLSALFMIVIGLLGPQLKVGARGGSTLVWSLVVSQYIFFVTGVYSAFAGTSSMFAGPSGLKGTATAEFVALAGNVIGVIGSTVAAVLLLWGLRARQGE